MCFGGGGSGGAAAANQSFNADTINRVSTTLNGGGFDPATYLAANPDVMQGWQTLSPADRSHYPTPESYAAFHAGKYGDVENRPGRTAGDGGIVGNAQQGATNLVTTADNASNDLLSQLTKGLADNNTNLTNSFNTLLTSAQTAADNNTKSILDAFTAQTDATKQSNADLLKNLGTMASFMQSSFTDMMKAQSEQMAAAEKSRLNMGQKARAPNLLELMKNNKARMGSGNSSTMMTGPSGITTTSLSLGGNTLLGA